MAVKVRFTFGCVVLCREKECDAIIVVLDLILISKDLVYSLIREA
ncbi:hypothetical protein GGR08_000263 [Bartonella fuyuanensis]|uniref:Uncharacterized protein n=1 Tax=Bartonella fuyuanensis TaxID=1460968 RepID=A0A840DWU4_9HYPH|nr:hypothetical protein [Bartonella fuyuanensis]